MGLDAVLELFPGDKRTEDIKAAMSGLGVTDMATLADAVVKGSTAVAQVETSTGRAKDAETKLEGAIFRPGENATPEIHGAYNRSIGVPVTISEYGLSALESDEGGKAFLGAFLKAGVRKDVAATLVSELNTIDTGAKQAASTQQATAYQAALVNLGENAEAMAKRGLEVLFPGDENSALREAKLKDPDLVAAWFTVGRASTENPKQFQNIDRGPAHKSPYPSMDSRGIK